MKFSKELLRALACKNVSIIDWQENEVKYHGNKVDFQFNPEYKTIINSIEGREMAISIYDEDTIVIGIF